VSERREEGGKLKKKTVKRLIHWSQIGSHVASLLLTEREIELLQWWQQLLSTWGWIYCITKTFKSLHKRIS